MQRSCWPRLAYYAFALVVFATALTFLSNAELTPADVAEKSAARTAAGKSIPVHYHVSSGLWWGASLAATIAVVLAAAGRWTTRPFPGSLVTDSPRPPSGLGKILVVSTIVAVATSAVLNFPRMTQSLWGDEEYSLKKAIVGEFARAPDDSLTFEPRPWSDTFFNYRSPNNHVFFSVLSRLSNSAFGPGAPGGDAPDSPYFSEFAIRLPAYIAGLLAIASLAWFLAVFGFPRAALIAPWLLILHPWFVRYSTEARGYAIVFALAPFVLGSLLIALRSGRWRWWIAFSVSQFLVFYTYPGTVYFILLTNAAALLSILRDPRPSPARSLLFGRWFSAGCLSALAVVSAMTPLYPQLRHYLTRDLAKGEMGTAWLADATAYLTTGIAWEPWHSENPLCLAWKPVADSNPSLVWIGLAALAVVYLLGCTHLCRSSLRSRIFAAVLVLPPILTYLHNAASGTYMFRWYLVPALPLIVATLAVGLVSVGSFFSNRFRDSAILLATLAFLSTYAYATHNQRKIFRHHAFEPLRESVALTRPVSNPFHPKIDSAITIGFHMQTRGYDPAARRINTAEELRHWMRQADIENLQLHINFAQPGLARATFPDIVALAENADNFTPLPPMWGLDEQCTRLLYRYIPGSLDKK